MANAQQIDRRGSISMNSEDPKPLVFATHKANADDEEIPHTQPKRKTTSSRASKISKGIITKDSTFDPNDHAGVSRPKRGLVRRASMSSINSVATSIRKSYNLNQSRSRPFHDEGLPESILEDQLQASRDSTELIIQHSWDEVEKLQAEVSEQDKLINAIEAELEATRTLLAISRGKEKDANDYYDKMSTKLKLVKYENHHSSSSKTIDYSNSTYTKRYQDNFFIAPSLSSIGDDSERKCSNKEKILTPAFKRNVTWPRAETSPQKNFWLSPVKNIARVEPSVDEKDLTIRTLQMKLLSRDNIINSMEDMISNHIELLQKHPHIWKK